MNWIENLFFGAGTAHSVMILAITIAIGVALGKLKIGGISLGMTWILFIGIIMSHFGMRMKPEVLHFVQEFGLILFVYSIGLQVGPSFFSSFKKGGLKLNMLAVMVVLLGVVVTVILYNTTGLPISTMVGIMSGAVTNTPGLGAAQQAYTDITGMENPDIALGYAVAYPLGVIGIIFSLLTIRFIFRIKMDKEANLLEANDEDAEEKANPISVLVKNPAIFGKTVKELSKLTDTKFIVTRIFHSEKGIEVPCSTSVINEGDKLFVVTAFKNTDRVVAFIGEQIDMCITDWNKLDEQLVSRRIVVTNSEIHGKTIEQLGLRSTFGINITRINRAGIDLLANPKLQLQIGDKLTVVGIQTAIDRVSNFLGNSMKRLREPNLIPIFIGIYLGIILGSIPIMIPGIPQPIKLGLAGGPLVVSLLISKFGPKYKLVTYTTMSANLMLREIGISLFLACVGLGAGEKFVQTIIYEGGYAWIGYGVLITIIPLLIVGIVGRAFFKINYFTLMGLLAGSTTDPPALAYANSTSGNDMPAVAYATVYPLSMFMRVLAAQLLILLLL